MWSESLTIYNPAQDINDMLEAEERQTIINEKNDK